MAGSGTAVLELEEIHAGYGEIEILRGVTVGFEPGTITAVIGANGAGKSTLLKTIFGAVRATSGAIRFQGTDITATKAEQRLRSGIAIVLQGRCNFPLMTVRENLEMGAYVRSDSAVATDVDQLLSQYEMLGRKQKVIAGNLSGGEQQILEMCMALLIRPRVILLDEPSLGLSPKMLDYVFATIRELARKQEAVVVMVEQNAVQALKVSDRGIVLELGRVSHQGSGVDMLSNPSVRESYLGLSEH